MMSSAHPGETELDDRVDNERPRNNANKLKRGAFGIKAWRLSLIVRTRNVRLLERFGGVRGIASALETSLEDGLKYGDDIDIARRRKAFGANTPDDEPRSFAGCLGEVSSNFNTVILLVCGILSTGLGTAADRSKGWKSGASMLIAVFVAVLFTSVAKYIHCLLLQKTMQTGGEPLVLVDVVRAGNGRRVPVSEIVVGDVVYLKPGDRVPGHGFLLEAHSLKLDVDIYKEPFLFSGSKLVDGSARMLVTSVATHLKLRTRLLKKLNFILRCAICSIILVFLTLLVLYIFKNGGSKNGQKDKLSGVALVNDRFESLVTIITALLNVPDTWELCSIFARTHMMKKIVTDGDGVTLIRPSALESLSSVTVICTNKTGILTEGNPSVVEFWLPLRTRFPDAEDRSYSSIAPSVARLLRDGVALNKSEMFGSSTEEAISSWGREKFGAEESHEIVHTRAFNPYTKRGGIRTKRKADGTVHVHWKGSPESILEMCSTYYDISGAIKDLDDVNMREFKGVVQGMAAARLRCVAFAHKRVLGDENGGIIDSGLSLLGVAGVADLCRPGVRSAIMDFGTCGVKIKMITGDNIFTAKAVAAECGILTTDDTASVLDGHEFRNLEPEQMVEAVHKMSLMAEASPDDQRKALLCLKQKGHTIVFAGDGSEPTAQAMIRSDVGFVMGSEKSDTEVGDIVVRDGNFSTVLKLVRWRRCVYNNTQKFAQLFYAAKASALFASLANFASAKDLPLTPLQLIWLKLVTNALGALAFSTEEPARDELLGRPLSSTKIPFVTNVMMRNILPQAMYQTTVLLILFFKGRSIFGIGESVNNTLLFNSYVLCQVFNEINSRRLESKKVFGNMKRMFLLVMAVTVVFQVLSVEILKKFLDTERLSLLQWIFCVGIATMGLPIGFIARFIPLPTKEIFGRFMKNEIILV